MELNDAIQFNVRLASSGYMLPARSDNADGKMNRAALVTTLLLATTAVASTHDYRYNDNTNNIEGPRASEMRRIENGRRSDHLTSREYRLLRNEQARIAADERRTKADGYVSHYEPRHLNQELDQAKSRHLPLETQRSGPGGAAKTIGNKSRRLMQASSCAHHCEGAERAVAALMSPPGVEAAMRAVQHRNVSGFAFDLMRPCGEERRDWVRRPDEQHARERAPQSHHEVASVMEAFSRRSARNSSPQ